MTTFLRGVLVLVAVVAFLLLAVGPSIAAEGELRPVAEDVKRTPGMK